MSSPPFLLSAPEPVRLREKHHPSLLAVFRKRRKIGFVVFLSMMALTGLWILFVPRTYEGSMQFMVNNDRVNTPVGSDSGTQAIVYMNDINETLVNTEVSLLTSNDLMLQLVRQAGLAYPTDVSDKSPEQQEQRALKTLKTHLHVTPIRRSAMIDVRYSSGSRGQAVRVLEILSRLYLDSHVRLHGTPGAYQAFERLWTDATAQRIAAELLLNDFKRTHNIVSLPEEKTIALQREADLQRQYADASVAAGRSDRQTQELNQILARTPSSIEGERKSIPNQSEIEQLNSVLNGLQLKRVEAAARYQPTDRTITDLDQQIAETKAAIDAASSRKAEEISVVANPVLHEAQTEVVRLRGDYAGFQEQAEDLRRKLATNRRWLVTLDEDAATYNSLNESVTRFTELERLYRQKTDAARADQFLDENHVSNVTLTEAPFSPPQPSPRVTTMVALGLIWSLISSGFTMLILDRARTRVTTPIDVERSLGAPVIAYLSTRAGDHHPYGYLPTVYSHIVPLSPRRLWRLM